MTEEAKKSIQYAEELWCDTENNKTERERDMQAQIRELIGLARGLVVAVEAAVASRPVVNITNN